MLAQLHLRGTGRNSLVSTHGVAKPKAQFLFLILAGAFINVPQRSLGFPGVTEVKSPPANAGDTGLIPKLGRSPGGGNGNPLFFHYSSLGNPWREESAGYSPRGHKESDMSEHAHKHTGATVPIKHPPASPLGLVPSGSRHKDQSREQRENGPGIRIQ